MDLGEKQRQNHKFSKQKEGNVSNWVSYFRLLGLIYFSMDKDKKYEGGDKNRNKE